jgi:hypothetical protein
VLAFKVRCAAAAGALWLPPCARLNAWYC